MKRLVLLSITVLFVLGMSHGMTQACQCQPPLFPEEGYEMADAVFRGLVIDISPADCPDVIDITIAVVGYWKGTVTTYMHVYTGTSGGSCGYEGFELYEEYLIYADAGYVPCIEGLGVSICNRTRPIAAAGTDLEYLGNPQTIPVEQMTWGAVKEIYRDLR
jgi:hypothetical protein